MRDLGSRMHEQGRRLFPALNVFPGAISDARHVPAQAEAVRLTAGCIGLEALPQATSMKRLWCFGIKRAELDVIASCHALEALYLEEARATDVSPLLRLPRLTTLRLEGATRIAELDALAHFGRLEGLSLEHLPKVRSLEPLRALHGLQALDVSGSMWTRMKVQSLAPLAALRGLAFLQLANLASDDESLAALAELPALRELECAGFYPWQEFARLARALPNTECAWFHPTSILSGVNCEACGAKRVMLTGKGQPTLCPCCDASRIQKHAERFLAAGGRPDVRSADS